MTVISLYAVIFVYLCKTVLIIYDFKKYTDQLLFMVLYVNIHANLVKLEPLVKTLPQMLW